MGDSYQSLTENQHIGIAAFGLPDGCTFFTERVLKGALQTLLRRSGVEWLQWIGSRQPEFVVQIITVGKRGPALQAVHASLDEIGILRTCQIAYFDCDELYWRTVYPLGAEPFDHFLDPDKVAAAGREFMAWMEAYEALLRRRRIQGEGS